MTYSSAVRSNCVVVLGVTPYSHSALVSTLKSERELLMCSGNLRTMLVITFQHLFPEKHFLPVAQGAKHLNNITWGRIIYFYFLLFQRACQGW